MYGLYLVATGSREDGRVWHKFIVEAADEKIAEERMNKVIENEHDEGEPLGNVIYVEPLELFEVQGARIVEV